MRLCTGIGFKRLQVAPGDPGHVKRWSGHAKTLPGTAPEGLGLANSRLGYAKTLPGDENRQSGRALRDPGFAKTHLGHTQNRLGRTNILPGDENGHPGSANTLPGPAHPAPGQIFRSIDGKLPGREPAAGKIYVNSKREEHLWL